MGFVIFDSLCKFIHFSSFHLFFSAGKGKVPLWKWSTASVLGNPVLHSSGVLKGFPVNCGASVSGTVFRLSLCRCGLVSPCGHELLSLSVLDTSAQLHDDLLQE